MTILRRSGKVIGVTLAAVSLYACGDEGGEEMSLEPMGEMDVVQVPPMPIPGNFAEIAAEDDSNLNMPQTSDDINVRPLLTYVGPKDFKQEVLDSTFPVVVDFYASWCGPCHYIAPYFKKLAEMNPQVKFVKYDVDQDDFKDPNAICNTYKVSGIPAFRFFHGGKEYPTYGFAGAKVETLRDKIKHFLEELKTGKSNPNGLEGRMEGPFCPR